MMMTMNGSRGTREERAAGRRSRIKRREFIQALHRVSRDITSQQRCAALGPPPLLVSVSHDLAVRRVGHPREPRLLPGQAARHAVEKANEGVEPNKVVRRHQDLQISAALGNVSQKEVLEEAGDDQQDVQKDCLHGLKTDKAAEVVVLHNAVVQAEEDDQAREGKRVVRLYEGLQGREQDVRLGELPEEELPISEPVQQGKEVRDGSYHAVPNVGLRARRPDTAARSSLPRKRGRSPPARCRCVAQRGETSRRGRRRPATVRSTKCSAER